MKHWPYRFKTEKEMIADYGVHWRGSYAFAGAGWVAGMDYLLGTPLECEFNGYRVTIENTSGYPGSNTTWKILASMLTENKPKVPNYKPKKFKL